MHSILHKGRSTFSHAFTRPINENFHTQDSYMQIVSAGTAFPENSYDQQVITAKLQERWSQHLPRPETLSRLHTRCGVDTRNLVLPLDAYDSVRSWGQANDLWIEAAQSLGRQHLRSRDGGTRTTECFAGGT